MGLQQTTALEPLACRAISWSSKPHATSLYADKNISGHTSQHESHLPAFCAERVIDDCWKTLAWQTGRWEKTQPSRMIGFSSLMLLSDTLATSSKPCRARSHNDLRRFIRHIWAAARLWGDCASVTELYSWYPLEEDWLLCFIKNLKKKKIIDGKVKGEIATAQCCSYPPEPDLNILIKHYGTLTQWHQALFNIMRRFRQTVCVRQRNCSTPVCASLFTL